MVESDFIENVQSHQEEEGTLVGTLSDIAGFLGMFILYVGLFRLPVLGEFYNGLVTLLFGSVIFVSGLYGPPLAAALHARDKKYIVNYVFYGSRMVRRDMELIEDPLVLARLTEEDEIEFVKKVDDTDYETAVRALGGDFLTDKDIDKKMETALKQRYKKAKERTEDTRRLKRLRRSKKEEKERTTTDQEDVSEPDGDDDEPPLFSPIVEKKPKKRGLWRWPYKSRQGEK